jgi:hypothetical protein
VAKGLPPRAVVLRHMGRNVLAQLWTTLPVIFGILVSGLAIIEYMMEVHGIGRALVLAAGPTAEKWFGDRCVGVILLFPPLLLFLLISAATDAGLRWVDPRVRDYRTAREEELLAGRKRRRTGAWQWPALPAFPQPARVGQALKNAAAAIADSARRLPAHLLRGVRALRNPVLLAGVVMVTGLVLTALFARQIAPYDPEFHARAYQDAAARVWAPPFAPGPAHWLDTDGLGRDMLSRVLIGTRYALAFAALATPARFVLGVLLGMMAAWRGACGRRRSTGSAPSSRPFRRCCCRCRACPGWLPPSGRWP